MDLAFNAEELAFQKEVRDWIEAKTQAECYDYLFGAAVRMRELGIDPARRPA